MRKWLGAALAVILASASAQAASVPLISAPWEPGNALGILNNWIINSLNTSVATNPGVVTPGNVLDNGDMTIDQRGTGIVTCGTTSGPAETAYAADRWACDANVTSGAGRTQVAAMTVNGTANGLKLYRNSGALTQPICAEQEIHSSRAIPLNGQTVIFNATIAALAGLVADNGGAANLVILTGTGTDQGLGALQGAVGMTASPAITPVWTGLATASSTAITLTGSPAVYNSTPTLIPLGTNEIAVMVCFTPTATGAGTTDGLQFTNAQLQAVQPNVTALGAFTHKTAFEETSAAYRYYWEVLEPATGLPALPSAGTLLTTTTCQIQPAFPFPMWTAPVGATIGTLSTSTFNIVVAADTSTLASTYVTYGTNTSYVGNVTFKLTTASTAGWACLLQGQGASGSANGISFGADF
jgi:hypothetical protein